MERAALLPPQALRTSVTTGGALIAVAFLQALAGQPAAPQAPPPGPPLTILARDSRKTINSPVVSGQPLVSLDDLATAFQLTIREDTLAGGVTVSYKGKTLVLATDQGLASVGGRLISLPSAPVRTGRTWLVPLEFINRALALIYDAKLDLRKPSRLVIVGELRVPRVAVSRDLVGSQARITLDVAPATPHTITMDQSRLLVTFDADTIDAAIPAAPVPGLVDSIRVSEPSALAIELGPRYGSFKAADLPGPGGTKRIVIDVVSSQADAAAPPRPPPPEPPSIFALTPPSAIRTIVLDPGHGGDDAGARGKAGAVEKELALAVARRLKNAIESRLGIRVLLTRDDDRTLPVDERAALANSNAADLFLSLHANASLRPSVRGAEVFYLSLDERSDQPRRDAAAGGQSVPAFGGATRRIDVVPWENAQARYLDQSAALASLVEAQLGAHVEISPHALERAPLRVLVGANMPAVLVEMGYLSNPDQERQLVSGEYQNALTQALVESVVHFRDYLDRARRGTRPQDRSRPPGGLAGSEASP